MNDLSYKNIISDTNILKDIGEFVKSRRITLNMSQNDLAERAAISRSTLSLLERGENIALANLIKILRVLDALYLFDNFKPVTTISPMKLALEEEKKRKRYARKKGQQTKTAENNTWEW